MVAIKYTLSLYKWHHILEMLPIMPALSSMHALILSYEVIIACWYNNMEVAFYLFSMTFIQTS